MICLQIGLTLTKQTFVTVNIEKLLHYLTMWYFCNKKGQYKFVNQIFTFEFNANTNVEYHLNTISNDKGCVTIKRILV